MAGPTFRDLAKRCESATGPDSWLSADIGVAFGIPGDACPDFTGSLDAAYSKLPENWASVEQQHFPSGCWVRLTVNVGGFAPMTEGNGATPALALCAAILRMYDALEEVE